ncbi:hypothetical protein [Paenibacillus sp.]|uniref:hypothetical protein n=1 Tax=Paenibacillus sp. TaxID=58172 RepID=UPI002D45BC46|nr:hypothetical protein [Paenibacillus sp.]HZG83825.1 hypothetical protein [Paenibacillus sp.]
MPYNPTSWVDRIVQEPLRFKDQNGNTWILTPDPGTVTQAGTPFAAALMNKIEQGLQAAASTADAALPKNGSQPMTGSLLFPDGGEYRVGIQGQNQSVVFTDAGDVILRKPAGREAYVQTDLGGVEKIWTAGNDGSGSGLDADLVRGISGDRFLYGANGRGGQQVTDANGITRSGFFNMGSPYTGTPTGGGGYVYHNQYEGDDNWASQIFVDTNSVVYSRIKNNGTWGAWKAVGGMKVVQRGETTLAAVGGDVTVTIPTAVNMSKAFVNITWQANEEATVKATLTSSNGLRLVKANTNASYTVSWEVMESN